MSNVVEPTEIEAMPDSESGTVTLVPADASRGRRSVEWITSGVVIPWGEWA